MGFLKKIGKFVKKHIPTIVAGTVGFFSGGPVGAALAAASTAVSSNANRANQSSSHSGTLSPQQQQAKAQSVQSQMYAVGFQNYVNSLYATKPTYAAKRKEKIIQYFYNR